MSKVILVYADCESAIALGDFVFAGSIARDLAKETITTEVRIILTSSLTGIARFEKLYGTAVDGSVLIEDQRVGLCALELFDSVAHEVITFIDANRCKLAPAEIVKRALSPASKFIFIGNAERDVVLPSEKTEYIDLYKSQQDGLYEHFDPASILVSASGLGDGRLGLARLKKVAELPPLSPPLTQQMPQGNYGFIYLNAAGTPHERSYQIMAQYMGLSPQTQYVLVGFYAAHAEVVKTALVQNGCKSLPVIHFHQSLPNGLMRRMVSGAGDLVVTTGVMSALEGMQDGKLPFYQDFAQNAPFMQSYLLAVKSLCASDASLIGAMPELIINLSTLLFCPQATEHG